MSITLDPEVQTTEGGQREQRWALPAGPESLERLLTLVFEEYWEEMWFGIIMEGAAWEVAAPCAPVRMSMYDGYLTVDFGRWHFHLCIGEHTASGPELGKVRQCARAELYRNIGGDDTPTSWGIRLFNGRDEQMMTVMLPNPFLTPNQQIEDEPQWPRLEAWDRVRREFLGIEPETFDRTGKGFKRFNTE